MAKEWTFKAMCDDCNNEFAVEQEPNYDLETAQGVGGCSIEKVDFCPYCGAGVEAEQI